MKQYLLEIATNDFNTSMLAVEGGADRIELCAAISEGGITQSYGTIKKCREAFAVPIFPIIRPRAGDFFYNEEEFEIMKTDIKLCREIGCDGIVTGLLFTNGDVDKARTAKLIQHAYPMEVTFHRAFDRCKDPFLALEDLIEIGCQRILTSGQQLTAPEGADLITELIKLADNRIIIMPGSGIRKENIKDLALKTGAIEFHSSLRSLRKSKMEFVHPSFQDSAESYLIPDIISKEVQALKKALN